MGFCNKIILIFVLAVLPALQLNAQECFVSADKDSLINFGKLNIFELHNINATSRTFQTGNVLVRCNNSFSVSSGGVAVKLSISEGSSGNYQNRTMRFGIGVVNYNLYIDSTGLKVFGSGLLGTNTFTRSLTCPNGADCQFPVYGRILSSQNLRPGLYSDTVTVQVDF